MNRVQEIQANIDTVRSAIRALHNNQKSNWLTAATEVLSFLIKDLAEAERLARENDVPYYAREGYDEVRPGEYGFEHPDSYSDEPQQPED